MPWPGPFCGWWRGESEGVDPRPGGLRAVGPGSPGGEGWDPPPGPGPDRLDPRLPGGMVKEGQGDGLTEVRASRRGPSAQSANSKRLEAASISLKISRRTGPTLTSLAFHGIPLFWDLPLRAKRA